MVLALDMASGGTFWGSGTDVDTTDGGAVETGGGGWLAMLVVAVVGEGEGLGGGGAGVATVAGGALTGAGAVMDIDTGGAVEVGIISRVGGGVGAGVVNTGPAVEAAEDGPVDTGLE